ncbi:MAG TPA: hypothetical protein VNO70_26475 [Blastocatellia bacterium]|nr:hypothetical protein [Blastocatellia bacterium]
MGAFNRVKGEAKCPFCGHFQEWTIQFKYGNCRQFDYEVGNKIRWGGNENGRNVGGNVRTEGMAEETCAKCRKEFINAAVYFSDNRITKIELLTQPLNLKNYFEILD